MSAAALDLSTTTVHQFWDKVVAANPNLEAVVKAANSNVLQIVASNGKLYIFAVNVVAVADIPPWITFAMQVQFPGWPWFPPASSGFFTIEFKVKQINITIYDSWHHVTWHGSVQAPVPPPLVGLKIEGTWNSR